MTPTTLTPEQVLAADLADWRFLLGRLHARFTFDDYAVGLALVAAVGAHAAEVDHHPDLDLRHGALRVVTSSHDADGVTERDVALARRVSELAAELGARPEPTTVQQLEIALDTPDLSRVKPFWRAVLGLADRPGSPDEVRDEVNVLPALWFQECDPPAPGEAEGRMRFHLDITVPHDVAEQRVAAALAAGGTLVSDAAARAFWVLADAEGNKACVCTWQDR
ncbi:VOC family protein [Nocardioides sp. CPCC 205120]|uniref:VOC family protein n=1 Tax=Nocardioides sp. CPCC 205120 TaxID=3406462 RepID=UPI003B513CFE